MVSFKMSNAYALHKARGEEDEEEAVERELRR